MLGYVHLTAGRPVLERRAAAGMTYWAWRGPGRSLFPGRRLRRWMGRLERCGVSHAALPPAGRGILPLCVRFCRTDCGWRCCRSCWTPWPRRGHGLLLADCADSRAAGGLPYPTGASGTCGWRRGRGRRPGAAAAAAAGADYRRRPRRRHRDLRPPPREGLPLYLTPDCALRQEVRYAWPDPSQAPPPEGLLSLLHQACRLPEICVKSVETLDIDS